MEDRERAGRRSWGRVARGQPIPAKDRCQVRCGYRANRGRLEYGELRGRVIGGFAVLVAMRLAQAGMRMAALGCHVRTGFRHPGHARRHAQRVPAALTGVGSRCQLNCQERNQQECGNPVPVMGGEHEPGIEWANPSSL